MEENKTELDRSDIQLSNNNIEKYDDYHYNKNEESKIEENNIPSNEIQNYIEENKISKLNEDIIDNKKSDKKIKKKVSFKNGLVYNIEEKIDENILDNINKRKSPRNNYNPNNKASHQEIREFINNYKTVKKYEGVRNERRKSNEKITRTKLNDKNEKKVDKNESKIDEEDNYIENSYQIKGNSFIQPSRYPSQYDDSKLMYYQEMHNNNLENDRYYLLEKCKKIEEKLSFINLSKIMNPKYYDKLNIDPMLYIEGINIISIHVPIKYKNKEKIKIFEEAVDRVLNQISVLLYIY